MPPLFLDSGCTGLDGLGERDALPLREKVKSMASRYGDNRVNCELPLLFVHSYDKYVVLYKVQSTTA